MRDLNITVAMFGPSSAVTVTVHFDVEQQSQPMNYLL